MKYAISTGEPMSVLVETFEAENRVSIVGKALEYEADTIVIEANPSEIQDIAKLYCAYYEPFTESE